MEAAENYIAIMEGRKKDIMCSMSTSYNTLVERNRQILVSIVDTIILCGHQNIALRGHEEKDSNFKALLQFQARHNTLLKEHLETADPCTKYTSPEIQNEIIHICGDVIVRDIVAACNKAPCFGFIADEATDVATIEQMALCVRFYDEDTRTLREDFLGFAECQSTTGAPLTDSFLEYLRNMDIKLEKMRGQGYDGAANMSGRFKGVQSRIQVQTIGFAFNYSAKRMLYFQETLAEDPVSRNEMDHGTKLQSLCETRWASRADSLHTFLSAFTTVVRALRELATELEDTKAAAYRQGVLTFEFIVTLVALSSSTTIKNVAKIIM